jgi:hypothetical protein
MVVMVRFLFSEASVKWCGGSKELGYEKDVLAA